MDEQAAVLGKRGNKRKREGESESQDWNRQIQLLEKRIRDSQANYNEIKTLLRLADEEGTNGSQQDALATLALCRVFCRLHADGKLSSKAIRNPHVAVVRDWLKERYDNYLALLLSRLNDPDFARDSLGLLLTLMTEVFLNSDEPFDWKNGLFATVLDRILGEEQSHSVTLCEDFAVKFGQNFNTARAYTFARVGQFLRYPKSGINLVPNALAILSHLEMPRKNQINTDLGLLDTHMPFSVQRKNAQRAWLALLSQKLDRRDRKKILGLMTSHAIPWFSNVEVLMDFLSDSFDQGGATSLLALEGLFYLMREKNLDYPDFYVKLYSLLDSNLLYSKYRSQFFGLLETFMASTHLPAAMVASFVKRLSRLSLHGPPAGIVVVIPWVYNMLKTHPTCTFMIHREPRTEDEKLDIEQEGIDDVFDMEEMDPMQTDAIDSCLWEIETLQSHYHPNVASLARIISEQFTKRSYNLEDFLNHSYMSLLESELDKPLKKTAVVEFQIPKKVFQDEHGNDELRDMITQALEVA